LDAPDAIDENDREGASLVSQQLFSGRNDEDRAIFPMDDDDRPHTERGVRARRGCCWGWCARRGIVVA